MNEYVILTTPACSLFNNNKCKLFYEPSATVWRILNLWRSLGQKGFWDGFNFKSHPLCCHFVDWSKQKCSYFLSEFIELLVKSKLESRWKRNEASGDFIGIEGWHFEAGRGPNCRHGTPLKLEYLRYKQQRLFFSKSDMSISLIFGQKINLTFLKFNAYKSQQTWY